MMAEDDTGGLLAIGLSTSSDSEDGGAVGESCDPANPPPKLRGLQTEAEFQAVRQSYVPKMEGGGNLYKTASLPSLSAPGSIAKPEAQALLHAVEELYYFRQFAEGASVARRWLNEDGRGVEGGVLDVETREMLLTYEGMCLRKLSAVSGSGAGEGGGQEGR